VASTNFSVDLPHHVVVRENPAQEFRLCVLDVCARKPILSDCDKLIRIIYAGNNEIRCIVNVNVKKKIETIRLQDEHVVSDRHEGEDSDEATLAPIF